MPGAVAAGRRPGRHTWTHAHTNTHPCHTHVHVHAHRWPPLPSVCSRARRSAGPPVSPTCHLAWSHTRPETMLRRHRHRLQPPPAATAMTAHAITTMSVYDCTQVSMVSLFGPIFPASDPGLLQGYDHDPHMTLITLEITNDPHAPDNARTTAPPNPPLPHPPAANAPPPHPPRLCVSLGTRRAWQ